jgi:cytochrome P450
MPDSPDIDELYAGFELADGYGHAHDRGESVTWLPYGGGMWMISGFEELSAALRDDQTFSSEHHLPNGHSPFVGVMNPPASIRALPIELDPPAYQGFRRLLAPFFTSSAVETLRPSILAHTTWCVDQHIEAGSMDLLDSIIFLVPALVTMELLGLPLEDSRIIAEAVHARGESRFDLNPAWLHLVNTIDATVTAPTPLRSQAGLLGHLLTAEVGGRPLTRDEIVEICFGVVVGGMSTTSKLALGALSYFGVHLAERRRAIDDPGYLHSAIEEFLRYYSPVPFLSRTVTRDITVGGKKIKRGERVALGFAAANRDPAAFQDANAISPARKPNRHLALGLGAHFCIGSHLGRAETAVIVQQTLLRMPDYAIISKFQADDARRRTSWDKRLQRGLTVRFTPGPRIGPDRHLVFNQLPSAADHIKQSERIRKQ